MLVNNAGIARDGLAVRMKQADWDLVLRLNLDGAFLCIQQVLPSMMRNRWGRIVNICGLSRRRAGNISGLRNAAIVHLTKTLADQLGASGITVNLVHPGLTRTERTGAEDERRGSSNAIRRMLDAKEIAQVVTFLASTKAANITGVAIDASGGSIPVMFQ